MAAEQLTPIPPDLLADLQAGNTQSTVKLPEELMQGGDAVPPPTGRELSGGELDEANRIGGILSAQAQAEAELQSRPRSPAAENGSVLRISVGDKVRKAAAEFFASAATAGSAALKTGTTWVEKQHEGLLAAKAENVTRQQAAQTEARIQTKIQEAVQSADIPVLTRLGVAPLRVAELQRSVADQATNETARAAAEASRRAELTRAQAEIEYYKDTGGGQRTLESRWNLTKRNLANALKGPVGKKILEIMKVKNVTLPEANQTELEQLSQSVDGELPIKQLLAAQMGIPVSMLEGVEIDPATTEIGQLLSPNQIAGMLFPTSANPGPN